MATTDTILVPVDKTGFATKFVLVVMVACWPLTFTVLGSLTAPWKCVAPPPPSLAGDVWNGLVAAYSPGKHEGTGVDFDGARWYRGQGA